MVPGPGFGREVGDLPVGGGGQAREDVTQVSVRIDSATAAAFDDSSFKARNICFCTPPIKSARWLV